MGRLFGNPNAWRRTINTGNVKSHSQLTPPAVYAKEKAEEEAFKKAREEEAKQEEQRELIAMRHAIYAAKKLVKSKDKRRRRRLSKEGFKMARKLKVTRTRGVRIKKSKRKSKKRSR